MSLRNLETGSRMRVRPAPAATYRILALIDHASLEHRIDSLLSTSPRWGYRLEIVPDVEGLLRRVEQADHEALLVEDIAEEDRAADLLPELVRRAPHAPILMITDHGRISRAEHATAHGASDYIVLGADTEMMLPHRLHQTLHRERGSRVQRKDHDMLRRLLDTAQVGLMSLSPDGKISYVNTQAARMLGRSPDHLVGTPYLGPIEAGRDRIHHVRTPGAPVRTLSVRMEHVETAQGQTGYAASLVDVTKATSGLTNGPGLDKRLRSIEDRHQLTIATFDHTGALEEVFGTALAPAGIRMQSKRRRLQDLTLGQPELRDAVQMALRGEGSRSRVKSGGQDLIAEIEPTTDADGTVTGGVLVAIDVTELDLLGRRERSADDARSEAERAEELFAFKTQLLNRAAHELNTPLTPLTINAEVLAGGSKGPLTDDQRRVLATMQRNLGRLRRAVNRMIDVEKASRGALDLQRQQVRVDQTIKQVLEGRAGEAELRHVGLDASAAPVTINADPTRLRQAIGHLVDNAIQASPKDSHVAILAEPTVDQIVIKVIDEGRGFTQEQKESMFEALAELAPDRSGIPSGTSGLGVGLFLTRAIVAQHGGRLVGQSPGPGKGAVFTIYLPRVPEPTEDDPEDPTPPPADSNP